MPSIANTLRTISAIPPRMRCALAKSPLALRAGRASSARPRLAQHRRKPHASSFAPKRRAHGRILRRHASWESRSAEGRVPSGPALHTLPNLMAKPLCPHAARLEPANRQALEELVPKLLQALLHAEPPALLFYRGKRCWMSNSEKREPRASLIKRLCKQLQPLQACHLQQILCALFQQYRLVPATL